eukprot:scaffold59546_cov30-Phaeocystis_antarctica.AAC.1
MVVAARGAEERAAVMVAVARAAVAKAVGVTVRLGTRPRPTPARPRFRSCRRAPREAPPACTAARRIGCIAPARPPTSRCSGSHPSPPTSCRTRRMRC